MLRPLLQQLAGPAARCAGSELAACSTSGRTFSTTAIRAAASLSERVAQLAPEQQQQLATFQQLLQQSGEASIQAGLLTSLTAIYRNLYVTMDQFHKKDILGVPRPLVDTPRTPEQLQDESEPPPQNTTQQLYPIRDLTQLPDVPPPGLLSHLSEKYMGRQDTCWLQLLPNHLEVSYQVGNAVYMWPAMEAFYPFPLDEAAVRAAVRPYVKLRRVGKRRHRPRKHQRRVAFLGQMPRWSATPE